MKARSLKAETVGLPRFEPPAGDGRPADLFDLSSHRRAREALEHGLAIGELGFNVFVLGEDRSGRMRSTIAHLRDHVRAQPAPDDWVYLNNFRHPHEPRAYRLKRGTGRRLRAGMAALIPALRDALVKAFESPDFGDDLRRLTGEIQSAISQAFSELQEKAGQHGLRFERTQQGLTVAILAADGTAMTAERLDEDGRRRLAAGLDQLRDAIHAFNTFVARESASREQREASLRRDTADRALAPLIDAFAAEFADIAGLNRWLVELRADLLDRLDLLMPPPAADASAKQVAAVRYAVNLLVDNEQAEHRPVILEPNPTYENVFGAIEYVSVNGVLETDFTRIRPGALHRANGGILILRAEALARESQTWEALKAALRDREIRIEEPARAQGPRLVGAPSPMPIKLDVKVVIVGAPRWYYTFFSADPDFQIYFKVKADIDPDLDATAENLAAYAALLRESARTVTARHCDEDAIRYLLGQSARWAGQRDKLTGRFELLEDVLTEAGKLADADSAPCLTGEHVKQALDQRRRRNARIEDRTHEQIVRGTIRIDTEGSTIGQINGLTVQSTGDHNFGRPARVTARTFAGERGVANIERDVSLGGPIQQKGVLVLGGFLSGHFAQRFPLSFSASITFEQSYGGVEGDSASLAELIAILSSLAEAPIRQDIAITGSVDQHGNSQSIGGVNEKIEGFFRLCQARGLDGRQGVIIPEANAIHVTLRDPVAEAIAARQFNLWAVGHVDEAIELLTGIPAGETIGGDYPAETIYGRVMARLEAYDRLLAARAGRGEPR